MKRALFAVVMGLAACGPPGESTEPGGGQVLADAAQARGWPRVPADREDVVRLTLLHGLNGVRPAGVSELEMRQQAVVSAPWSDCNAWPYVFDGELVIRRSYNLEGICLYTRPGEPSPYGTGHLNQPTLGAAGTSTWQNSDSMNNTIGSLQFRINNIPPGVDFYMQITLGKDHNFGGIGIDGVNNVAWQIGAAGVDNTRTVDNLHAFGVSAIYGELIQL